LTNNAFNGFLQAGSVVEVYCDYGEFDEHEEKLI
jgi:hypothetical protein